MPIDTFTWRCRDRRAEWGIVLMAYVDESGDTGPIAKGGTRCYSLGCVLISDEHWPSAFDQMIGFRRRLSQTFRINQRWELKAHYLTRGAGTIKHLALAPRQRHLIYRGHLSILEQLNARAFAVVIDKDATGVSGPDCFHMAWETLLSRLERTSTFEKAPLLVIHDEGEDHGVRREFRKARRHLTAGSAYGTGQIRQKGSLFLDDPVSRSSQNSHFIQIADLVAYAGWRSYQPPGRKVAEVCPSDMWSNLGPAMHTPVNRLSGGVPGVVVRKR
ncbi:hypothetical protein GP2_076_00040 [Gordonia paraffinivorans NBRC 108238]|uniref:DUF3800 domain-containing protein n=1 Tax=Gordonia paraffinivorans NBRC 108238 TaxID=1223543 RepID=A0ABQ0IRX1_9ACTN|nr:DUF3800 domain-containing protein [Gordonia paraffinivorans]GAC86302.1 hypothetical protein GP2_076_00040 [Gordonia paraffinivorans NBRC 108238]